MDTNHLFVGFMALLGFAFTLLQLWIHARYSSLYDKISRIEADIKAIRADIARIHERCEIYREKLHSKIDKLEDKI